MAYEIIRVDGDTMHVGIQGVMSLIDHKSLQAAAMELIGRGRKLRLFVTLEHFQGWEKGVDWGDVGFLMAHGDDIAKIAIVGEQRWEQQVFAFAGKGLRATEIEFFPPGSVREAESWIQA